MTRRDHTLTLLRTTVTAALGIISAATVWRVEGHFDPLVVLFAAMAGALLGLLSIAVLEVVLAIVGGRAAMALGFGSSPSRPRGTSAAAPPGTDAFPKLRPALAAVLAEGHAAAASTDLARLEQEIRSALVDSHSAREED